MKICTLTSTMNLKNEEKLISSLNLKEPFVIINQITKETKPININTKTKKILSFYEKGLSKSRNKAIENCDYDFFLIGDDDLYYEDNYIETIKKGFSKYPDADIIAFFVDNEVSDENYKKKKLPEGKLNILSSMKVQSVQLVIKKKALEDRQILFDENFGAGTENFMGEENIFLVDCIKNGMKLYSFPGKIGTLKLSVSTWFDGRNENYLKVKGKMFKRMFPILYPIIIIQFAYRKRKKINSNINFVKACKIMFNGIKK